MQKKTLPHTEMGISGVSFIFVSWIQVKFRPQPFGLYHSYKWLLASFGVLSEINVDVGAHVIWSNQEKTSVGVSNENFQKKKIEQRENVIQHQAKQKTIFYVRFFLFGVGVVKRRL